MKNKLLLCSRVFYTLWFLLACCAACLLLPEFDFSYPEEAIIFSALMLFLTSAFLCPFGLFCREEHKLLFHIGTFLYVLACILMIASIDPNLSLFLVTFLCVLPYLFGTLFLLLKKKRGFLFVCSTALNAVFILLEVGIIALTIYAFSFEPSAEIEGNVVFLWLMMSFYALCSLMPRIGFLFLIIDAWRKRPLTAKQIPCSTTEEICRALDCQPADILEYRKETENGL